MNRNGVLGVIDRRISCRNDMMFISIILFMAVIHIFKLVKEFSKRYYGKKE